MPAMAAMPAPAPALASASGDDYPRGLSDKIAHTRVAKNAIYSFFQSDINTLFLLTCFYNLLKLADHIHDFGSGLRNENNEDIKIALQKYLQEIWDAFNSHPCNDFKALILNPMSGIEDKIRLMYESNNIMPSVHTLLTQILSETIIEMTKCEDIIAKADELRKNNINQIEVLGSRDYDAYENAKLCLFITRFLHGETGLNYHYYSFDAGAGKCKYILTQSRNLEVLDRAILARRLFTPSNDADSALTSLTDYCGVNNTEFDAPKNDIINHSASFEVPKKPTDGMEKYNGPVGMFGRDRPARLDKIKPSTSPPQPYNVFTIWDDYYITVEYVVSHNYDSLNRYNWSYKVYFKYVDGSNNTNGDYMDIDGKEISESKDQYNKDQDSCLSLDLSYDENIHAAPSVDQLAKLFYYFSQGGKIPNCASPGQINLAAQFSQIHINHIKRLIGLKYNIFFIIKILGDWGQIFSILYLRTNTDRYLHSTFISIDPTACILSRFLGVSTWQHAEHRHRLYRFPGTEIALHPHVLAKLKIDNACNAINMVLLADMLIFYNIYNNNMENESNALLKRIWKDVVENKIIQILFTTNNFSVCDTLLDFIFNKENENENKTILQYEKQKDITVQLCMGTYIIHMFTDKYDKMKKLELKIEASFDAIDNKIELTGNNDNLKNLGFALLIGIVGDKLHDSKPITSGDCLEYLMDASKKIKMDASKKNEMDASKNNTMDASKKNTSFFMCDGITISAFIESLKNDRNMTDMSHTAKNEYTELINRRTNIIVKKLNLIKKTIDDTLIEIKETIYKQQPSEMVLEEAPAAPAPAAPAPGPNQEMDLEKKETVEAPVPGPPAEEKEEKAPAPPAEEKEEKVPAPEGLSNANLFEILKNTTGLYKNKNKAHTAFTINDDLPFFKYTIKDHNKLSSILSEIECKDVHKIDCINAYNKLLDDICRGFIFNTKLYSKYCIKINTLYIDKLSEKDLLDQCIDLAILYAKITQKNPVAIGSYLSFEKLYGLGTSYNRLTIAKQRGNTLINDYIYLAHQLTYMIINKDILFNKLFTVFNKDKTLKMNDVFNNILDQTTTHIIYKIYSPKLEELKSELAELESLQQTQEKNLTKSQKSEVRTQISQARTRISILITPFKKQLNDMSLKYFYEKIDSENVRVLLLSYILPIAFDLLKSIFKEIITITTLHNTPFTLDEEISNLYSKRGQDKYPDIETTIGKLLCDTLYDQNDTIFSNLFHYENISYKPPKPSYNKAPNVPDTSTRYKILCEFEKISYKDCLLESSKYLHEQMHEQKMDPEFKDSDSYIEYTSGIYELLFKFTKTTGILIQHKDIYERYNKICDKGAMYQLQDLKQHSLQVVHNLESMGGGQYMQSGGNLNRDNIIEIMHLISKNNELVISFLEYISRLKSVDDINTNDYTEIQNKYISELCGVARFIVQINRFIDKEQMYIDKNDRVICKYDNKDIFLGFMLFYNSQKALMILCNSIEITSIHRDAIKELSIFYKKYKEGFKVESPYKNVDLTRKYDLIALNFGFKYLEMNPVNTNDENPPNAIPVKPVSSVNATDENPLNVIPVNATDENPVNAIPVNSVNPVQLHGIQSKELFNAYASLIPKVNNIFKTIDIFETIDIINADQEELELFYYCIIQEYEDIINKSRNSSVVLNTFTSTPTIASKEDFTSTSIPTVPASASKADLTSTSIPHVPTLLSIPTVPASASTLPSIHPIPTLPSNDLPTLLHYIDEIMDLLQRKISEMIGQEYDISYTNDNTLYNTYLIKIQDAIIGIINAHFKTNVILTNDLPDDKPVHSSKREIKIPYFYIIPIQPSKNQQHREGSKKRISKAGTRSPKKSTYKKIKNQHKPTRIRKTERRVLRYSHIKLQSPKKIFSSHSTSQRSKRVLRLTHNARKKRNSPTFSKRNKRITSKNK